MALESSDPAMAGVDAASARVSLHLRARPVGARGRPGGRGGSGVEAAAPEGDLVGLEPPPVGAVDGRTKSDREPELYLGWNTCIDEMQSSQSPPHGPPSSSRSMKSDVMVRAWPPKSSRSNAMASHPSAIFREETQSSQLATGGSTVPHGPRRSSKLLKSRTNVYEVATEVGMLVHGDTLGRAGLRGGIITRTRKTQGQNDGPKRPLLLPTTHALPPVALPKGDELCRIAARVSTARTPGGHPTPPIAPLASWAGPGYRPDPCGNTR